MRAANILACIAILVWLGLFLVGVDLTKGVINQRVLGYPNAGQLDYYVLGPAVVVMTLLAIAWLLNSLRRWPWLLALISAGALFALLPFLLAYSGGV